MKNPKGPDPALRLKNRSADPALTPFKFLFAAYRPDRWWYEVVETIRRLTMTGLLTLVPDPEIRLSVAIFLAFASLLLHTTTEPFSDSATNTLALVSHLLVFMVFFAGQQIAIGIIDTNNLAVGIFLVVLLLSMPALIAYTMMTQTSRNRVEDLRRHEREVQTEEMFGILDQLKAKEDEFCARNESKQINSRRRELEAERRRELNSGPPPTPPPASLNISEDDVKFEKCSYPCYVMSLTNICGLDKLPSHEDAYQAGLLQTLKLTSRAPTRHHG